MIHGDVSRSNILYDDRRFALIDFGDAGAAPRVADAAIALAQLAIVGGRLRPEIWSGLWAGYAAIIDPSDDERAAVLPLVKLRYAKLIVDHVWRELSGRHHPGHLALVALGIEGLHALASAPSTVLSLDAVPCQGRGVNAARADADAGVHPGARRMFGVKDLFTVVNALAGVAALALCAEGHWLWACYAVAAGYAADMVDGSVARALREANRFGAEFDTAADFVTQTVAPALIVYLAYRDAPAALGLSPRRRAGARRRARRRVDRPRLRPLRAPQCASGRRRLRLDRPSPDGRVVRDARVRELRGRAPHPRRAVGGRRSRPGARGARAVQPARSRTTAAGGETSRTCACLIVGFLATTVAAFLFAPRFAWDVLLFWELGYVVTAQLALTPEERQLVPIKVREADARLRASEILLEGDRLRASARSPSP